MQRYFVKKIKDSIVYFYEDDFTHITKVMRFKIGDEIIVIYDDISYLATITNLHPYVSAKTIKTISNNNELQTTIDLFQASIKPSNFEWIVQKAVELHINNVYQLILKRTYNANLIKEARIKKIIKEASEQSQRQKTINFISNFSFNQLIDIINNYDYVFLAYERQKDNLISNININSLKNKKIAIIVGGEGGFCVDEIEQLQKFKNVFCIGLTKTILRSETASLYILSNIIERVIYETTSN